MIQTLYNNLWGHRIVFLAVNLLAIVIIASIVLLIADVIVAVDDQIAEKQTVVRRLKGIAAQEKHVQALAQAIEKDFQGSEFLHGANDGVASADLQTRLKEFTESAGARVRSLQTLPPRTLGGAHYISARIEIYGSLQSVRSAVYAIESGRPYLFISGAVLKLSGVPGRSNGAQEPIIQAQLDILGTIYIDEDSK
jgi:type II secretory pathway component PulJ